MSIFSMVTKMFQSVNFSVAAANNADKAYADGTGNPQDHVPFGEDQPEKVAVNVAGVYAVDTAANIIAVRRYGLAGGRVHPDAYTTALEDIYNGNLDADERYVINNCANLSWRAGQPFRGITTAPLARITRPVNMQFNELPVHEQDKDMTQIQAGAAFLLEQLKAALATS